MSRSFRRVQTESGMTWLDIDTIVAMTKKEDGMFDIHLDTGTIFTTPHLLPFMEDIIVRCA